MGQEKWPASRIKGLIYLIQGRRVMLDFDLAKLYGVTTFNLNKAVRRNRKRFPADFMFPVAPREIVRLIFQSGISNKERGGRRKPVLARGNPSEWREFANLRSQFVTLKNQK